AGAAHPAANRRCHTSQHGSNACGSSRVSPTTSTTAWPEQWLPQLLAGVDLGRHGRFTPCVDEAL
ncbi:hypothetical protein ACS0TM_27925, partial [Klebsiella pneumoniae]|uniref:hypothetical protein n=1 Tax=Klebsiella pneumoniae TaxID=573 RepID=UPI003FCFE2B3